MKHEGAISEEKLLVMLKEKEVKNIMNVKWSSKILIDESLQIHIL